MLLVEVAITHPTLGLLNGPSSEEITRRNNANWFTTLAGAAAEMLQDAHVLISMVEVGAAWQNGYAKRLLRTIKEEEISLSDYDDYDDAARQLGRLLDEGHVQKRIHSSLGYLTRAECEEQWRREHLQVALFTMNRSEPVQLWGGTTGSQEAEKGDEYQR